jgi:alpha-amylase
MTVYFSFLLHIYQPPTQIPTVLRNIVFECYRPLMDALLNHSKARISLNINGTLTEQLHDFKFDDVIESISKLLARGQIELTGSGKYHPLLPLLPEPEVVRQIKLNEDTNRFFFGNLFKPKGFFPPEMAVSDEILKPIKDAGYDWIIMSGIANTNPEWPTSFVCQDEKGLNLLFRDDVISVDIAFDKINNVDSFINRIKYLNQDRDYYVILALDGETFGHHVKHAIRNFLIPLFESLPTRDDVKMVTVSEIVKRFPKGAIQVPKASSWSTNNDDISCGNPYPLWLNPKNDMHKDQYKFMMFALTMVSLAQKFYLEMSDGQKEAFNNSRNFLDRGEHSCAEWWASKRPWYSPDMIMRGMNELLLSSINAKRSVPENATEINDAMIMIMQEMLQIQNKIILALN